MTKRLWMKIKPFNFIIIAVLLISGREAFSQSAGTLRGTVTDPSAAVVPNATITAAGNGLNRTVKSDGQGHYTLPNVPPGKYNIRADAPGFITYTRPDVDVPAGQASALDIALQIATESQQIQVNDQALTALSTDSSSNVSALILKDADLDALPDDPDDLQADLEALAGPAAGPNGAQFFVDGFSGGQLPPKSSIREIRINSNPFSSEFDRPGFGRVEILTKPGTDNFHGQAFINYGDKIFDSRNPLLTTEPPAYSSKFFTANLGGPINKKASFFIDFNRRDITENALVVAKILDSDFNETPYNAAVLTPNALWQISPRIDYQLNATNTLVLRYNHTQSSNVSGVGGFSLPTQETQGFIKNNQVQITETAILGTKAVDETRFQFRDNHNNQNGVGTFDIPGVDVSGSFSSGGAPFAANFTHNKGYELQNIVTTSLGKHALKAGFRARQTDLSSQSTSNFNGTWLFNAPNVRTGIPACLANIAAPTSLDLYQQTEVLLAQGVPISTILAEGCGPSQFTLSSGIPLATVRQFDLGAFVQDDWRVFPNLTLNSGIRYETQNNIHDHLDFAPRFGLAWAPGAKGKTASKTVIRAGYGIFFDRISQNNIVQALRFNGATQTNYLITAGSTGAADALAYFAPSPNNTNPGVPPLSLLTVSNQAIYILDRHLRAPYMGQLAIGVDRQLPGRTQVSVNFVNTRGIHTLRQRDINAPLPGTYTGPGTGVRPFAGTAVPGSGGDIYQYETSGIFKQTQVTVNANSRINSHLQLQGYYSFGEAHTNANGFPMDQYNANQDWGRANFDIRHRAFIGGNVGLPFRLSVAPFVTMSSGAPFNITTGQQFNGDGIINARPGLASASTLPQNLKSTPFGKFDLNPLPGVPIIPVNYGDGPSEFSVNLRVSRTWGWGERAAAGPRPNQGGFDGGGPGGGGGRGGPGGGGGGRGGGGGGFRGGGGGGGGRGGFGNFGGGNTGNRYNVTLTVSARNAFNHVNLAPPSGILTSPFFGQSTALAGSGGGNGGGGGGGGFGGGNGAAGNRKVEIQLRFQF
jgi:hypothetical protein